MKITINTKDYVTYKPVTIDGVDFGVRMLNSAETLEVANMQRELSDQDQDASSVIERLTNIFFGLYDKPEKAKEVMSQLSVEALSDIYKKVMES